ncbi:MAG: AraC family transcriptional regulator, partial [Muribaculaceae bacterium]|nr:AraC family transcriptional regulator [Muribaculaceae bacterium]
MKTFNFPEDVRGPKRVTSIAELCRGEIYVGNYQGLFRLANDSQALVQMFPDKINFAVNALADDGNNRLYVGTRHGLFRYDKPTNSLEHMLLIPDILSADNEVSGLWYHDDHGLWIATLHNLFRMDSVTQALECYPVPGGGSIKRVAGINDTLYLGTHGSGVIPFDMSTCMYGSPIEFGNNIITSLFGDGDNMLYVATDGEGIFKYSLDKAEEVEHYSTSLQSRYPIRSNSVYSMLVDDKGLMWIGYYQMGVDYTPHYNDLFEVYEYPGLVDTRHHAVRAVAVDGPRKVIGTREGLYYVDESTGRMARFVKPDIKSNIIFCITPWRGKYYIGTYGGGMYVLDPETMTLAEFDTADCRFSSETVFAIEFDHNNDMWVGSSDGVYRFSESGKEKGRYMTTNSQLPEGNVYDIFFDSTGRGWMCTENGMAIWDGKAMRADRFPKGFVNNLKIRDVYEDSEHMLYFAPDRGPVFKSNMQLTDYDFITYGISPMNTMTAFITEDNQGWIWFGTDKGLMRYDKRDRFYHYNNADGLPNVVFTLCPPVKDEATGDIWMGNTNG